MAEVVFTRKETKAAEQSPKANLPGPYHKLLEQFVGDWEVSLTTWQNKDAPPINDGTGTVQMKMIMDGRYLQQDITHKSKVPGQSFKASRLWGYDNLKKSYVRTLATTSNTGIGISEGSVDATGKVFTFQSQSGKGRTVLRLQGPDRIVSEAYARGDDGKEFKTQQAVYTRTKRTKTTSSVAGE